MPRVAALAVWDAAIAAPWQNEPVWFHGDVAPGNLVVHDGRLAAVIDFGATGVGDPACDLTIAWTLFSGERRAAERSAGGTPGPPSPAASGGGGGIVGLARRSAER